MPEGYTHISTGEKALLKSGVLIYDRAAFCAGTQGPDPLFFFNVWRKTVTPDLHGLGSVMHNEKTGKFLMALIKNAKTKYLKSYVMGFLTHYATDKNAHPYVNWVTTRDDAPYNIKQGHGFFEIALDGELHLAEHGARLVPLSHSTLLPPKADIYDISVLLHVTIKEVYGLDIKIYDIYKSFLDMKLIRKLVRSRFGIMRKVYKAVEVKVLKNDGYILSHLTPAQPLKPLPPTWENDFLGEIISGGIEDCLKNAVLEGANFLTATNSFWEDKLSQNELLDIIGNRSYETNLEV